MDCITGTRRIAISGQILQELLGLLQIEHLSAYGKI